eukprot:2716479-Rhodomonas_salina.8
MAKISAIAQLLEAAGSGRGFYSLLVFLGQFGSSISCRSGHHAPVCSNAGWGDFGSQRCCKRVPHSSVRPSVTVRLEHIPNQITAVRTHAQNKKGARGISTDCDRFVRRCCEALQFLAEVDIGL